MDKKKKVVLIGEPSADWFISTGSGSSDVMLKSVKGGSLLTGSILDRAGISHTMYPDSRKKNFSNPNSVRSCVYRVSSCDGALRVDSYNGITNTKPFPVASMPD